MNTDISPKRKTTGVYLLMICILFQAISGLMGGISFILYPSGELLKMSVDSLRKTPFNDYLIPGLILFFALSVYPASIFYALINQPNWKWMNKINIYKDQKSAWTHSLYLGIILVLWIDFEVMLIGYSDFIQTFYALVGVAILILTMLPSVKNYFHSGIVNY